MPHTKYAAIPEELRLLPQWVVWGKDKVPYDAKTGKAGSVIDPATWCDFATAIARTDYNGPGFVFTNTDEYTVIDLDDTKGDQVALNRQIEIHREFNSYSEISPSGRGLHIIVRGSVPAGRRRSFIEIYSSQRYATFTGNVYNNAPIKDCQDKLMQLWHQMGDKPINGVAYTGDNYADEKFTDAAIVEQASKAVNGDKFQQLYTGRWNGSYPSQSEADLAIINIIAFYTQNRNQIGRIFRASALGKRDKANRTDYLAWMINKSFDRMLPPIDFDGFKQQIEAKIATQSPQAKEQTAKVERIANTSVKVAEVAGVAIPPGLLGELAKFIYAASPRPVPEIALAGAIGLMSGIVGRTYNTNTNAGLNNYVLLLANTGTGKDSMSSGIDALMEAVAFQCPYANNYIGPSEIASGQALVKHVSNFQCFVSILGEFGIRIEQLSNARASSSERTLKRILLDIYTKSKYGQMFRGSIYADKDKNVEATKWPALSLIGDSQPERFYSILNEDMISEGLLPRFLIIEYTGPRPPLNKYQAKPSQQLVNDFASLLAYCESIMHPNSVTQNQVPKVIIVQCEPAAQKILDDFDTYADKLINSANKNIIVELWSRAHLKALKLASLVAVGVNMFVPTVQPSYVEWAIDLVRRDIAALVSKFEKGLVGVNTGENKQQDDLVRIIRDFVTQSWDDAAKYCQGKSDSVLHRDKLVPYSYLSKRLIAVASFRNDRVGATNALKRSIQLLVDGGKLQEIDKKELISRYNSTQRAFVVSDLSLLDG